MPNCISPIQARLDLQLVPLLISLTVTGGSIPSIGVYSDDTVLRCGLHQMLADALLAPMAEPLLLVTASARSAPHPLTSVRVCNPQFRVTSPTWLLMVPPWGHHPSRRTSLSCTIRETRTMS